MLSLRHNRIGAAAGAAIAAALSNPASAISALYLGDNVLETKGVLDIAHALMVSGVPADSGGVWGMDWGVC